MKRVARVVGKTRSAIVRDALDQFFSRMAPSGEKDPYQILRSFFPLEHSGISDLGSRSEDHLRKKFRARSRPR